MALPTLLQLFPSGAIAPSVAKGYFQAILQSLRDTFGDLSSKASAQKTLGVAVVDRAYNEQVGSNSLAPTIPYDNTIPQSTEGTQIHQGTITPKSTTNRLRVRVQCPFGSSWVGADFGTLAVFVNGEASARRAVTQYVADGAIGQLNLEFEFTPGTTTAQAFVVRVGCSAGSFILGGSRVSAALGGVMVSSFIVEEITA